MPTNCKKCNKAVNRTKKGVDCANCGDTYHVSCGVISESLLKEIERGSSDWRCAQCRLTSNRRSLINTGMERRNSTSSINTNDGDTVQTETPNINTNFSEIVAEIKKLSQVQHTCFAALESITAKIEELQTVGVNVAKNEKRIQVLEKDNKHLRAMVKSLSIKFDNNEQKTHLNKLQLCGVPQTDTDNLTTLIQSIGIKLNVDVQLDDIIEIHRVKNSTLKRNSTSINNSDSVTGSTSSKTTVAGNNMDKNVTNTTRTPIITVTFRSISKRNEMLNSYRTDRNIFFGNDNQCKIFINEFLSPSRRRLFIKSKLFCKEMKYKYVWIRNGEIFIRKDDGAKKITINQFTDFTSIDGARITPDQLD